MPKEFNTIFMKSAIIRGYSSGIATLRHMLRMDKLETYERSNKEFYTKENEKFNLYSDESMKLHNKNSIFDAAKNKLDTQILEFKKQYEFKTFGHEAIELEIIKKQIMAVDYNKFFMNNLENKNILDSIDSHKVLKKFIKENDIPFSWNEGLPKNRRISWEEYLDGWAVKFKKGVPGVPGKWVKEQGKYSKEIIDPKTGSVIKETSNLEVSFVSNFQIHASREWFEKLDWLTYEKQAFFNIDPNTSEIVPGYKNISIEENKMPEEFKRWFKDNIELFKEKMKEVSGSTNNLLAISLHMDESKPHIDFLISNIWKRDYYLLMDKDLNKFKPIAYDKALKLIEQGDAENLIKKERLSIVTDFKDERLQGLINTVDYSLNTLLPMHTTNYDKEIKGHGYAKEFYGEKAINYLSMDNYRKMNNNNMFNFVIDKNTDLKTIRNKVESIDHKNEIVRERNDIFKNAFINLIEEAERLLIKDKKANLDSIRTRLTTEAGITDLSYIDKILDNIKENVLSREKIDRSRSK